MTPGLTFTQKLLQILQIFIVAGLVLSAVGLFFAWQQGNDIVALGYMLPVFLSALGSWAGIRVGMAIVELAMIAASIKKTLTEWPRG